MCVNWQDKVLGFQRDSIPAALFAGISKVARRFFAKHPVLQREKARAVGGLSITGRRSHGPWKSASSFEI
jgi:hypothetical protein